MIWARDRILSRDMYLEAKNRNLARTMYLLECDSHKFENDDEGQFCCCEDSCIKPECNCHFKLEHKLKLPLRGAELDVVKRDETPQRGIQRIFHGELPLRRAKIDEFAVVNSCNGLLCLSDLDRNYFVVCNPVTGEFIRLPEPTIFDKTEYILRMVDVGFGFQPTMGLEIHTLGTSTWRNVEFDPSQPWCLECPTCVSGVLYWMEQRSILCFDLESVSFHSFPYPDDLCINNITLGEYGGSLYLFNSSSIAGDGDVQMWIRKKNGFGESWTNVFDIDILSRPNDSLYLPVKNCKNGAALLMCRLGDCFIYREPEKYGFKIFKVRGTQSTFEAIPHIPSLISLKDVVEGDIIEVINVHTRCEELKLQEEENVPFLAKVNELTNLCYYDSSHE